jgi:cytochrome c-type biogenesis protein CcmH
VSAGFIVFAAVAALAALAWVAYPLLRRGSDGQAAPARAAVAAVAVVLLGGSAGLYGAWSNWTWEPAASGDTPADMVARLARRLEKEPDDVQGWLMLGRSHAALEQFPLAVRAFQRADRLEGGRNAEALTGWAEALVLSDPAEIEGRASRLFEQALAIDPDERRALFFTALAAQRRGETDLAIRRYQRLIDLGAPDNVRPILEQQIATLRALPPAAPGAAGPAPAGASPEAGAAADPTVRVRVAVDPAIANTLPAGAPLFVFVRALGQPGPPLAVRRLDARFPASVQLGSADLMIQGRGFAAGDRVEVVARVSLSGQPTASPGDPFGRIEYQVGRDGEQPLVIDALTAP